MSNVDLSKSTVFNSGALCVRVLAVLSAIELKWLRKIKHQDASHLISFSPFSRAV